MSRKFDRTYQINNRVAVILKSPEARPLLAAQIVRPRPRFVPRFAWYVLLKIVLRPEEGDR